MAIKKGIDAEWSFDAAGVNADPSTNTWTEIDEILDDVTVPMTKTETTLSRRKDGGHELTVPGLTQLSLEFTIPNDPASAQFQAFETAWKNGSVIALAAMDGDITVSGSRGPVFDANVLTFERAEPIRGIQTIRVVAKPCLSDVPPKYYTVA